MRFPARARWPAQSQLYGLSSSDFHDVTSGSNGNAARTGYDMVTGRGTPIASAVVRDLVANATTSTTGQSPTTPSTPTQTTTTVYEWVYWHHRWWLVAVTQPAATRNAIDSDSMNSGMQQVATAVASGATPSTSEATSGVAINSSAAAGASLQWAMTASGADAGSPAMITMYPSGGRSPRTTVGNPTDAALGSAAEKGGPDTSAPGPSEATACPGDDSATEGLEVPVGANWQVTRSLAEMTPRLPELAVDACFGGDAWAAPLEESISKIADVLAASREFDLAGIAVALVLGVNRAVGGSDSGWRETPWPPAAKGWLRRRSGSTNTVKHTF